MVGSIISNPGNAARGAALLVLGVPVYLAQMGPLATWGSLLVCALMTPLGIGIGWAAVEAYGTEPGEVRGEGGVNPVTATYLNRLSDLLWLMGREAESA